MQLLWPLISVYDNVLSIKITCPVDYLCNLF